MFKPKIIVTRELMEKLKTAAAASGCSSVDEFAVRALEAEADKVLLASNPQSADVDEITRKLKGLGYLE